MNMSEHYGRRKATVRLVPLRKLGIGRPPLVWLSSLSQ